MSALGRTLDLRPLTSLLVTQNGLVRAGLALILPLGLLWVAFVQLFNGVEVRVDDSDFWPKLALVALVGLPYAVGHVIGLTVGEVRRSPSARLLPRRIPRLRRATLTIGLAATTLSTVLLIGLTDGTPALAAYVCATLGYGAGVASAGATRSGLAYVACFAAAFAAFGNVQYLVEEIDLAPALGLVVLAAAVVLTILPFTRFGDRPTAETPVRRTTGRRVPLGLASTGSPEQRADAARRLEEVPSRRVLPFAILVTVVASSGPLLAALLRRGSEGLTVLEQLFEAYVGRTADGGIPGQGSAGAAATLAFGLVVLPLMSGSAFLGETFRPFSRATHARVAFRSWVRTVSMGTAALLAVVLTVIVALGWVSGEGWPATLPVVVVCALLLAPVAPWLTIGSVAAIGWARTRSGSPTSGLVIVVSIAAFLAAFAAAGVAVAVARDSGFDAALAPTPLRVTLYVLATGGGALVLRAFFVRYYRTVRLAPA